MSDTVVEKPTTTAPLGCTGAPPDAVVWVPASFSSEFLSSGSGAYHYRSPCDSYIVDVKQAGYSNSNPVEQEGHPGEFEELGPWKVLIEAGAYDLPSSADFGGTIPTVEEDCLRFLLHVTFYRKLSDETKWTLLKDFAYGWGDYAWKSGTCDGPQAAWLETNKNVLGTGWDTYRVVVSALLRTSAQEVGVWIKQPQVA